MLKLKWGHFLKLALLSAFTVFGLGLSHAAAAPNAMSQMAGHGKNAMQCLGICTTGLPSDQQNGILQVEPDDEVSEPAPYTYALVVLAFIVLTFVVKLLPLLSSWRPSDFVRLYGQYLFYAQARTPLGAVSHAPIL